jgi:hypothetical protein
MKTVEFLFDREVAGYVQEHFWHATEQFGTPMTAGCSSR